MKIHLFLNDLKSKKQLDRNIISKIYNTKDLFILRNDITKRHTFVENLEKLTRKNYIIISKVTNTKVFNQYDGDIPYISLIGYGLYEDRRHLDKIIKLCDKFKGKNTKLRINYVITDRDIGKFTVDTAILKSLIIRYNMLQPYFDLIQKGDFFGQEKYIYPLFNENLLNKLNKTGLLTQKNFDYLSGYINKTQSTCNVGDNITIYPDGTLRLCHSHRCQEVLGNLKKTHIADIIDNNKEKIDEAKNCFMLQSCWISSFKK